jgi:DNA excision repair protein ERCC-3
MNNLKSDIESLIPGEQIPAGSPPLIVQSDGTLLLEVRQEWASAARNFLCGFAQLERSPKYIHTYRITPLSLWNAAASGVSGDWILEGLARFSRYAVPDLVRQEVREQLRRFGRATLLPWSPEFLLLRVDEPGVRLELGSSDDLKQFWTMIRDDGFLVRIRDRGLLKQALVHAGYPAEDLCGYAEGLPLSFALGSVLGDGRLFGLRPSFCLGCGEPPAILARPSGPPVAIGMMILLSPEAKYTIP